MFLAFAIINNLVMHTIDWGIVLNSTILTVLVNTLVFVSLQTYRGIVRYTGMQDALRVFSSVVISTSVLFFAQFFNAVEIAAPLFSSAVLVLYACFSFLFLLGYRVVVKQTFVVIKNFRRLKKSVVIFGAGKTGVSTKRVLGHDTRISFSVNQAETPLNELELELRESGTRVQCIPLGGNRGGITRNYFNVFVTFVVSGIWHGANWTFVIRGSLHGFFNTVQRYLGFDKLRHTNSALVKCGLIAFNFSLVLLAWVFFRANTTADAFQIIGKIFSDSGTPFKESITTYIYGIFGLVILMIKEMQNEFYPEKFRFLGSENPIIGAFASSIMIIIILSIGVFDGGQFIYFQF